jgi:hypothetical protein
MRESTEVSPLPGEPEALSETGPLGADVRRVLNGLGIWPSCSILVLTFLFVSVALRAGRQGILGDEAFNWALFLRGSFSHIFLADYDANNHVLYTVLAWLSTHWMGLNEFNLRIPTIIAAAIFFVTVFRISLRLFGRRPWHLLCTILLAGNPYVLDFFTVARGYGLALAFFSLALCNVLMCSRSDPRYSQRLFRIGIWSAFSVCANLTFLFPVIALFSALSVELLRAAEHPVNEARSIAWELIRQSVGPFLVISFCVLVMPLRTATPGSFYVGALTWPDMVDSLLRPSFVHNLRVPFLRKSPGVFWALYGYFENWAIPFLALLAAIYPAVRLIRRRQANRELIISCLTFVLCIFGLWLAHVLLGVKLPIMRTGVYLLFLFPLALLSLLSRPVHAPGWRVGLAVSPVFMLVALCYARQWTPRATWDWRYDASTREFARTINILGIDSGLHNIRVGGSWVFEPALNYYRQKNGYSNWLPVVRQKASDPADFYVLTEEDRPVAGALKLRILVDDQNSRSVLAAPERSCAK